ncbi:hypothetical protein LWC34_56165 [Kibdelosporangium philippinense]|uniref:Uncharacterized protein n=1 Tax=Kibdelosporangium philippinense TaxID=211113 RepID=A0ABS8ZWK9_9PSEU|nr:hypothetical protein [Kibdelosporangium philippinense]MCE7012091.1 hypothetical protein [Kibdelosporangium philippinense]
MLSLAKNWAASGYGVPGMGRPAGTAIALARTIRIANPSPAAPLSWVNVLV